MLNRVPVNIRGMPCKIVFIPDEMFPIAPLPNTSFPSGNPAFRSSFNRGQGSGEACFYQGLRVLKFPSPAGKNKMKMLGGGITIASIENGRLFFISRKDRLNASMLSVRV
jgi:hypothetical protein